MSVAYHLTRLPGGLTVATAEMPHMASASVGLWVAVGGRHEPAEHVGISHFIEHMLFKGTRSRTAEEISQAVEGVGGYINAFTEEEHTCFYARAGADRFDDLLDVLADMLLASCFDTREIAKERDVIKEELAMIFDQPHQHVQELITETLWPDHPLGRPLTGTNASLDAIQRRDLVGYLRAHYVGPATLVTAAGNIRHTEVVRAVKKRLRTLPTGRRPVFTPCRPAQDRPRLAHVSKNINQLQLALGIRTCSRHDERRHALRVLNTILGENMSSRLFQVLREDRGLAYNIQSTLDYFDDVGALVISAGLDTDKLEAALKLIRRELRRIATQPPSAGEIRRARDYLIGQFELNLEGTENQMTWLGEQLLAHGRLPSSARAKEQFHVVTPSQVRAAARDFFRPEHVSLAVISPHKTLRGVEVLLSSL